jgi:hypothetical protein
MASILARSAHRALLSQRPALALATAAARRSALPAAPRGTLALVQTRALSFTARAAHPKPTNDIPLGNETLQEAANAPDHLNEHSFGNKGPPLGVGVASAGDEPGKEVNPYTEGPSAIEKAVHIFFLTEILRGVCALRRRRALCAHA